MKIIEKHEIEWERGEQEQMVVEYLLSMIDLPMWQRFFIKGDDLWAEYGKIPERKATDFDKMILAVVDKIKEKL